jgi:hypothetical protein
VINTGNVVNEAGADTTLASNPPLEERSYKFQKYTKIIVGLIILVILYKVTTDPNMLPEVHVKCLVDNFFTWTS